MSPLLVPQNPIMQSPKSPANKSLEPDRRVSFSPAHTLVPTYECFNRCSYCNFREDPGKAVWLSLAEAESVLTSLMTINETALEVTTHSPKFIEILVLSGEVHPRHPLRPAFLQHILDICELSLSKGFLPHTNVGPLTYGEMTRLKQVNVSMGLMVEQVSPRFQETVHRHAPSKIPGLRLEQLSWAGELGIPFTTGILLGIGETMDERVESLEAIARIHERWGHIQEVILQPYSAGDRQSWEQESFNLEQLPEVVAIARTLLPQSITVQIPPNLVNQPEILLACLDGGARDLGGIGPQDEVNPDYPFPRLEALETILASAGWDLVPRLPVYPQYDHWLSLALQQAVQGWRQRLKVMGE